MKAGNFKHKRAFRRALFAVGLCFPAASLFLDAPAQAFKSGHLTAQASNGASAAPFAQDVLYKSKTIQSDKTRQKALFLVQMEIKKSDGVSYRCTGALITQDVVLTAGHCLVDAQVVTVLVMQKFSPLKQQRIEAEK
ncbi:trypsin-like serine protease [Aquabacter spiritensis]|uniref:trypsin-like serine protease n=1 Tax=Aquabacter spiritensis TaxID=933073 RepID=UPI0014052CA3